MNPLLSIAVIVLGAALFGLLYRAVDYFDHLLSR